MTQIGTKEIEKIKSDIERGDYDLEKCMNLRNAKLHRGSEKARGSTPG